MRRRFKNGFIIAALVISSTGLAVTEQLPRAELAVTELIDGNPTSVDAWVSIPILETGSPETWKSKELTGFTEHFRLFTEALLAKNRPNFFALLAPSDKDLNAGTLCFNWATSESDIERCLLGPVLKFGDTVAPIYKMKLGGDEDFGFHAFQVREGKILTALAWSMEAPGNVLCSTLHNINGKCGEALQLPTREHAKNTCLTLLGKSTEAEARLKFDVFDADDPTLTPECRKALEVLKSYKEIVKNIASGMNEKAKEGVGAKLRQVCTASTAADLENRLRTRPSSIMGLTEFAAIIAVEPLYFIVDKYEQKVEGREYARVGYVLNENGTFKVTNVYSHGWLEYFVLDNLTSGMIHQVHTPAN